MKKKTSMFMAILAVCSAFAGCASVEPWERGTLARPHMAFDANPLHNELRTHAYSSREAAPAGAAGGGGACGCY